MELAQDAGRSGPETGWPKQRGGEGFAEESGPDRVEWLGLAGAGAGSGAGQLPEERGVLGVHGAAAVEVRIFECWADTGLPELLAVQRVGQRAGVQPGHLAGRKVDVLAAVRAAVGAVDRKAKAYWHKRVLSDGLLLYGLLLRTRTGRIHLATMMRNREAGPLRVSLVLGLLLMTFPGPPLDASESVPARDLVVTDFTSSSTDLGWYVQNDDVMGGRSEGDFEKRQGELIFAGRTNTNGGGFSSIRTKTFQLDLSNYDGIELRVKGDGRRYTWELQTNARWRGSRISYWADFETRDGEWSTLKVPFAKFLPQFRGYKLSGPELDPREITEMGLYIYDKQDGPFELHIASVSAYSAHTP